jgi:hypothetical protein
MMAEGYESGAVYLVATPDALCRGSAGCGSHRPRMLTVSGTLYGLAC